MQYAYPVTFEPDQNGTMIASIPDVPGTMSVGADRQEALERVHGALVAMLAAKMEDQESIPRPSRPARGQHVVFLRPVAAAKVSIYQAMRTSQTSIAGLAPRLRWDNMRVQRVLDPRRWSRIEDIEAALAALGKRLVVDVENAA